MNVLPKSIEDLIDELGRLPGVGYKSAARIAFFLQKAPIQMSTSLAEAITNAKLEIKICTKCFNLSTKDICDICADVARDSSKILVVEDSLDLIAIEKTGAYNGLYHVLGGVLSPMNGIGPDEVRIKELVSRLIEMKQEVELIIALNPNMEGESTLQYLQSEISSDNRLVKRVRLSRLARGLASGADIDYADNITIQKAYEGRTSV